MKKLVMAFTVILVLFALAVIGCTNKSWLALPRRQSRR